MFKVSRVSLLPPSYLWAVTVQEEVESIISSLSFSLSLPAAGHHSVLSSQTAHNVPASLGFSVKQSSPAGRAMESSTSTYIASFLILCCLISQTHPQDATKKIGKIKPPTPKTPNTIINDATGEELVQIIDEHQHVAVLFYEKLDKKTQKVLSQMEEMETEDLDVSIVR